MTVIINFGRRSPKSWAKRFASKLKGLISFQENIWIMINTQMRATKKKINTTEYLKCKIIRDKESEDLHWDIDWLKVIIQGTPSAEEEEYKDSLNMYNKFGKVLKRDFPKDDRLGKIFSSKKLGVDKIKEAYEQGYGDSSENNIANKLLEMGILTHIEWVEDFNSRIEMENAATN